jgi:transcriptional regulator with XRE-family HTH domain
MTPLGQKLRELRQANGVTLVAMARELGISSAYLSALEHGRRGRPSWYLMQRIIAYFNVIWDEAEQLTALARLSHPKVTIDTAGLSPTATRLANTLAQEIGKLDDAALRSLLSSLESARHKT